MKIKTAKQRNINTARFKCIALKTKTVSQYNNIQAYTAVETTSSLAIVTRMLRVVYVCMRIPRECVYKQYGAHGVDAEIGAGGRDAAIYTEIVYIGMARVASIPEEERDN